MPGFDSESKRFLVDVVKTSLPVPLYTAEGRDLLLCAISLLDHTFNSWSICSYIWVPVQSAGIVFCLESAFGWPDLRLGFQKWCGRWSHAALGGLGVPAGCQKEACYVPRPPCCGPRGGVLGSHRGFDKRVGGGHPPPKQWHRPGDQLEIFCPPPTSAKKCHFLGIF